LNIVIGFTGRTFSVIFSPDGHWLVAVSADGSMYVVDMTTPEKKRVQFEAHDGRGFGVQFSSDSQRFITFGEDHTTKIWNPYDLTIPVVLDNDVFDLGTITFSSDDTVPSWALSPPSLTKLACLIAGRDLTKDEWKQYFPDITPEKICFDSDSDVSAKLVISQHLLDLGIRLAGIDQDSATAKLKAAKQLNPKLKFEPKTEVQRILVQPLLDEGYALARVGNVNEATKKFQEAFMLYPTPGIDPAIEANTQVITALIDRGRALLQSNDIIGVLTTLSQIETLSPTLIITDVMLPND